jgi:tetratricopeptide (TPR) repeat protein
MKFSILRVTCLVLVLLLAPLITVTAQTSSATSPTNEANALFQAQKWAEAAKAYEAITKTEPDNGRAWYRLAYSLQKSNKYEDAAGAYEKAVEKL